MRQTPLHFVIIILFLTFPTLIFAQADESPLQYFFDDNQSQLSKIGVTKYIPKNPYFLLESQGNPTPLDFSKFGDFKDAGTAQYHFEITDLPGLKASMPSGVYPNQEGILREKGYQSFIKNRPAPGTHWGMLKSPDLQKAYYTWIYAREDNGVRTFFEAQLLEKSGYIVPALNAYYATVVHFPRAFCWGPGKHFVWYLAPSAIASIKRICRDYPELACELKNAEAIVQNTNDADPTNDIILVNPGKFVTHHDNSTKSVDLTKLSISETRGAGKVNLIKFSNGHWQMLVDGKPFSVHGITYNPTQIGLGPKVDPFFYIRWMFTDTNKNGLIDAPYESWIDANENGEQDENEPAIGDFELMRQMGVNAIRLYIPSIDLKYDPLVINKPLLRDLYYRYGIHTIIGHFLGSYTEGSGASWQEGTDYTNPKQRAAMKKIIHDMVNDLKDEPFVLMWLLGNENNMPLDYSGVNATRTNAAKYPKEYAEFVNEVAQMIHEIDPKHPVALSNLGLGLSDYYAQYAQAVDILAVNSYQGENGFGLLWEDAKHTFDRPVLISEYGCDAYYDRDGINENLQLSYHKGNVRDIILNSAGGPYEGNAIGGIIFEYLDEWWKDTSNDAEDNHQILGQFPIPFADGQSQEEWYGIVGQGSGKNSPFERRLRKSFYFYKNLWGKKPSVRATTQQPKPLTQNENPIR